MVPSQAVAHTVEAACGSPISACHSLEPVHSKVACRMVHAAVPIVGGVGIDVAEASGEAALVAEVDGMGLADTGQQQVACSWAPTGRDHDELEEAGVGVAPESAAFLDVED